MFFRKLRQLEAKMDDFLDLASEAGLVFRAAVEAYFQKNQGEFSTQLDKIRNIESRADKLRREIKSELYTETLIPESRGDILALLETTDKAINGVKRVVQDFSAESPAIPVVYHENFLILTDRSQQALESLVVALRAFFRRPLAVNDTLHKVHFFEKEADRVAEHLRHEIFASELDLAVKMHIRDFVFRMDRVADLAQQVADRLAIYVIKRTV
ncbi:MAG: DUF47 family protein [bacterium]|nr:DUF47 family protein [bacterium]